MTTESKIELYGYKQASRILNTDVHSGLGSCSHCAYYAEEYNDKCFNANCWGGVMLDSNKYNTTPDSTTDD